MTTKTRRRLFLAALVLTLALPSEVLMLRVLATPNQQEAVQQWVESLDKVELDQAASEIQSYPFVYRKEIMRALSPQERADVWRGHIAMYARTHADLDARSQDLLKAAEAAAALDLFSDAPSERSREVAGAVSSEVRAMLGDEVAAYLLTDLGDKELKTASAEPIRMRMENWIRGTFSALARYEDCDCSTGWGCSQGLTCSTAYYCAVDDWWPMCGPFWSEICDGRCW